MPAKTPIYLKTSTPKRGRKPRLREVLSSDMISPPLGDFRHSAHIGPRGAGDMFGELSFLQGRFHLLPSLGCRLVSPSSQAVGPAASSYRSLLRSAVSMPLFAGAPSPEQAPPKPPRLHLEELPGSQRSMSVSCGEGQGLSFSSIPHYDPLPSSLSFSAASSPGTWGYSPRASPDPQEPPDSPGASLPRSESLLGLPLDLGPSILDDVLRIMEEYKLPGTKAL